MLDWWIDRRNRFDLWYWCPRRLGRSRCRALCFQRRLLWSRRRSCRSGRLGLRSSCSRLQNLHGLSARSALQCEGWSDTFGRSGGLSRGCFLLLWRWNRGGLLLWCEGGFCAIDPIDRLGHPIVLVIVNVSPRRLLFVIGLQTCRQVYAVLLFQLLVRELLRRRWRLRSVLVPNLVCIRPSSAVRAHARLLQVGQGGPRLRDEPGLAGLL